MVLVRPDVCRARCLVAHCCRSCGRRHCACTATFGVVGLDRDLLVDGGASVVCCLVLASAICLWWTPHHSRTVLQSEDLHWNSHSYLCEWIPLHASQPSDVVNVAAQKPNQSARPNAPAWPAISHDASLENPESSRTTRLPSVLIDDDVLPAAARGLPSTWPNMKNAVHRTERKATLFSWPVLLSLGVVSVGVWAHARFVENRRENIALVIGVPALVAGFYDIHLRRQCRTERKQSRDSDALNDNASL